MNPSLFQILNRNFGLSQEALDEVRVAGIEKGTASTGETLIKRKLITEDQLLKAYSQLYRLPFKPELPLDNISFEYTRQVPIQFLKKYNMVPLLITNGRNKKGEQPAEPGTVGAEPTAADSPDYTIAINDPSCFQALDDLSRILGARTYQLVFSTKQAILSVINISYDLGRDSAEELVQNLAEDGGEIIGDLQESSDLLDDTSDAPIIKLANHIISQSIKARSSDIHIEPYAESFKVRYRVDGILYDLLSPPKWIQPALISRIKVMAKMNIAEKRLPQDGRFDVKVGDQAIDVRVSTIPTSFGERVVMRLLNKTSSLLSLSDLGLVLDRLQMLEELVSAPNGIILVTGPTGSGKTTTLYAILSTINKPDINIITVEDPIEYQIDGISQIQVNPKIELTFARGLRSIVRQDPDVILIGEIRDKETAEIAVQSALTGHLVYSTLHTNDSASAITRLVDIGVEPFLISSSVNAVIAQRLIRTLCSECKQPYEPDPVALDSFGIKPEHLRGRTMYRTQGCSNCFQTGYKGRSGIFEVMVLTSSLKTLILKTFDSNLIKREAQKHGMVSLRLDGIQKVLSGVTTIEEILRVTQL